MFGEAIATIVWSMKVIATANIMAASARFFFARGPRSAGSGLGHAAAPRLDGRWRRPVSPTGSLPHHPAIGEAEKGQLGKSDRRGRIVAAW